MLMEYLSARSLSLPHAVLGRLWRPAQGACQQHPEGCPVDALRAALAREIKPASPREIQLQEQEVLRTESEHRLLNGLQMVVGVLSLQSRAAGTPEVARQLSVAASRVAISTRASAASFP